MYIPKWLVQAALAVGAIAFGWFLQGQLSAHAAPAVALDIAQPAAAVSAASDGRPIALTVRVKVDGGSSTGAIGAPAHVATVARSGGATVGRSVSHSSTSNVDVRNANKSATVSQIGVAASGNDIVIATDGAVVVVGDDTDLDANTGDSQNGGVIGVETSDSDLDSSVSVVDKTPSTTGSTTTGSTTAGGTTAASPLDGTFGTVDIAGYEDHGVLVVGDGNIATYDDSNVFVDRDGKINANTGDTDSSGLNAVDTVDSVVSAGDHCDDGCDDESVIAAWAGHFDAGDSDGDEDSDSDDGDVSDAPEGEEDSEGSELVSTAVAPAAGSVAIPDLHIGGDGYDNVSFHVLGSGNVVAEDDSNVVVGGSGDVNAQIGDSDTGGTVTMGTSGSVVHGGNSR